MKNNSSSKFFSFFTVPTIHELKRRMKREEGKKVADKNSEKKKKILKMSIHYSQQMIGSIHKLRLEKGRKGASFP